MRKGKNIFKRKDGRWEGRVKTGYNSAGKIKYKFFYGLTYNDVKDKIEDFKENSSVQTPINKKISFGSLCDLWIKSIKLSVKESTVSTYMRIIDNYLKPQMSNKKLESINEDYINYEFKSTLKKAGLSSKHINNILSVLKCLLDFGFNKGYISQRVYIQRLRTNKKEIRVFDKNEKEKLEKYLLNNMNYFNFSILLTLKTGLRIGEISGLKIEDIDKNGIVNIKRTVQRIKNTENKKEGKTKLIIDTPKSDTPIRKIPISNDLYSLFKKLYKNRSGYLITANHTFVEPRTIENRYYTILKNCQIERVKFHTLRHTFATDFYSVTNDAKSLSEILGHSSIKITLDLYVHTSIEEKKRKMEIFNNFISSQKISLGNL